MAKKLSFKKTLESLAVGDSLDFPASKYRSVRSICSDYGFELGRRFSVKKDRENNKVIVTREE